MMDNTVSEKSPLVTVILPTYNRVYCIATAVQSVVDQSFTDWELLVIDNNSEDGTVGLVSSFGDPRISCLTFSNNGIVAASRNFGIRMAKGKYIAFLDSDDSWTSEKLRLSVNVLESGEDIVYHDLYVCDGKFLTNVRRRRLRTRQLDSPVFDDLWLKGNALNNSSVVCRTDILLEVGCLSEDLNVLTAEDYLAWLEISKRTERFKKIDQTLGSYWIGGDNLTSSEMTLRSNAYLLRYFSDKNLSTPGWMYYKNARAFLALFEPQKAAHNARMAIISTNNLKIKIKAFISWFQAKFSTADSQG